MKTLVIATLSAHHLARIIQKKSQDFKTIFPSENKEGKRYFPDGEIYMKIPESSKLKGKRVIVLHAGMPKPNEGLVELELILQILRDSQAKVEVFFSYFPYGMQDNVFEKGETNVAENLIEKIVNYYKVKKIYIIDPHFGGKKWLKKYPIVDVSALPLLIEKAKKDFKENILFLSPDIGGKRRTGVARITKMEKKRTDSYTVEIKTPKDLEGLFKGKVIGVIDDLLETGGTLVRFCEAGKRLGPKKIIALITHGVLPSGISKVKQKYAKLYLTNTVNQKQANIDITDLILETIKYD